jgi:hypothetical protein
MDQATPAHQVVLRNLRERGQESELVKKMISPRKICKKWQLAKEQKKKALQVRAAIVGDRDISSWETTGALGISRSVWEPIGLQRR